ncbi:hypothetical protein SH668x_001731 [Planctomicrobium sp. SH668]|uniref:hypothetical protein n=1 Tax=Planctomicrobium sp. SH668 TaxID=3448126 RepID=UPI003F5AF5F5
MATTIKVATDTGTASRDVKELSRDLTKMGDAAQEAGRDAVESLETMAIQLEQAEQSATEAAEAVEGIADPRLSGDMDKLAGNLAEVGAAAQHVTESSAIAGHTLDELASQTNRTGEATQKAADIAFDFAKGLSGPGGLESVLLQVVPKLSNMATLLTKSGPWGAAIVFAAFALGTFVTTMLEGAEATDEGTEAIKSQRDAISELNDSIAHQLNLKNQLKDLDSPEGSAKAIESKRRELDMLNEQAEAQRQLMIDERMAADSSRRQEEMLRTSRGIRVSTPEAETRWLEQAKNSDEASQKAHAEWLKLHREAVQAGKDLKRLEERNRELVDLDVQKKQAEAAKKFLDDQKQAWKSIFNVAVQVGEEFFDKMDKRKTELFDPDPEGNKIWLKAQEDQRRQQLEDARQSRSAPRDAATEVPVQQVQQLMNQIDPRAIAKELAESRLWKEGLDSSSIATKLKAAESEGASPQELRRQQRELEAQARKVNRTAFRDVQTGNLSGSEMAGAQADALHENLKHAQAMGKVGSESVRAISQIAAELANNTKELENTNNQIRTIQQQLNLLSRAGERRRAQIGGAPR